jgi:peptidoglycan hydrolase-like protein with peptidoglycan-binding domain
VLSHGHGLLIPGSAGEDVETLARLLAYAGFPTATSRGENPLAIFGESEREAANAFRRDYGIEEDPAVIAASVPEVVGPWTWEALYRIAERKAA